MASPDRAIVYREGGATAIAMQAMTDSGDQKVFTISGASVWSMDTGKEPVIRPNGIATGRQFLSPGASNDQVAVAAGSAYIGGTEVTWTAANVTITRPVTAVSKINAITVDGSGTLAAVAGTDGTTAAFSETYDAAGGPPLIPDDEIMIGQVRVASNTAAALTDDEIFQADGVHTERSDMPAWKEPNTLGEGLDASSPAKTNAHLEFDSALPEIHTSGAKPVYGQVFVPIFSEISRSASFKAAAFVPGSNSEEYYGGAIVSPTESLSNGTFDVLLTDGITDAIKRDGRKIKTFKFKPDRNRNPYQLIQGTVGLDVANEKGSQIRASITVVAPRPAADFAS